MTDALRTPDDRFADLPGYPFTPRYAEGLPGYDGLRMHYLDEGPPTAEHVFLCLHGQPTWSYLYRKMLPVFVDAGHRVVAPDLFGFGRSDKPVAEATYTFDFHRNSLLRLIEHLDLRGITLVCQDWGGILGLTLPMEDPDRWQRLLVMNTALVTGEIPLGQGFLDWREYCRTHPDLAIGKLMRRACAHLTRAERAAYDAPFPDVRYKAGVRRFPQLVADRPDAPGTDAARRTVTFLREQWQGESYLTVGVDDPVLGPPAMAMLRRVIRGAPSVVRLEDTGHFVQEWGEEVARQALAHFDGG